ncbi:MAG: carbohydrate-binding family 9-like protein [Bacteroides sp.]|nr:carbohydrate-binding family 9-like protein [Bacteroides sp.]
MKELLVKKVSAAGLSVDSLPALFDEEKIAFQPIDTVNWEEYPYRPEVQFRIAHTADAFLLHYKVREASVRAAAGCDNGRVWEDACVEFFSVPGRDGIYYNIECNCAGTLLIAAGQGREGRQQAPQAVLDGVKRWASLGRESFDERIGMCAWEVALLIPYSTFFLHDLHSLDGQIIRANFYKCGDNLQTPHFLSWNPIDLPQPDFHCPQHFGTLQLQ